MVTVHRQTLLVYPEFIVRVDSFECECLVISPVVARGWYVVCISGYPCIGKYVLI